MAAQEQHAPSPLLGQSGIARESAGPLGPTTISDAITVFTRRTPLRNAATGKKHTVLSRDRWIGRRLKWHLEWKLPDLWVGVFWRDHHGEAYGVEFVYAREIWICLLPCLPLCITTYGHDAKPHQRKSGVGDDA